MAAGRPVTMMIEGHADIKQVYKGCCGNIRRVGMDALQTWHDMMTLVDKGSGLRSFAANATKQQARSGWLLERARFARARELWRS